MSDEFTTSMLAPLVLGIYQGEELFFIHTEASDPQVAVVLTQMMGPQVVVVPELAQVSETLVADLYVFTNGVPGPGPLGFQPDVFTAVPGQAEYRPLHRINRVTWQDGAAARQLNSPAEILEAESGGEVVVERTEIVINAPILVWPGGHR